MEAIAAKRGSAPDLAESELTEARDAFTEEVRPHLDLMARLAARMAGATERDDIVQEALSRAWLHRKTFDPSRGTFRSWLLAITANEARKRGRRRLRLPALTLLRSAPSLDDALDVASAIAVLPPRQRLAIDCVYFVGLSLAETAEVMGCAIGTVKATLSDARARLRKELGDRNG